SIEYRFMLHGSLLPCVRQYTYLGVTFAASRKWHKHAARLMDTGNRRFHQFLGWAENRQLHTGIRSQLFQTYVLPTILYGAHFLDSGQLARLDQKLRQWERRLLHWPRGAPNAAVLGELGWWPYVFEVQRLQFDLFGLLATADASNARRSLAARVFSFALQRPGSWAHGVSQRLRDAGVPLPRSWSLVPGGDARQVAHWSRHAVRPVLLHRAQSQYCGELMAMPSLADYAVFQPRLHGGNNIHSSMAGLPGTLSGMVPSVSAVLPEARGSRDVNIVEECIKSVRRVQPGSGLAFRVIKDMVGLERMLNAYTSGAAANAGVALPVLAIGVYALVPPSGVFREYNSSIDVGAELSLATSVKAAVLGGAIMLVLHLVLFSSARSLSQYQLQNALQKSMGLLSRVMGLNSGKKDKAEPSNMDGSSNEEPGVAVRNDCRVLRDCIVPPVRQKGRRVAFVGNGELLHIRAHSIQVMLKDLYSRKLQSASSTTSGDAADLRQEILERGSDALRSAASPHGNVAHNASTRRLSGLLAAVGSRKQTFLHLVDKMRSASTTSRGTIPLSDVPSQVELLLSALHTCSSAVSTIQTVLAQYG
ncbi:pol, partial [Symbiodinium sp. CCMP2456]